jgi:hypothetical protein
MFQFNKPAQDKTNPGNSNELPNFQGKVRTFKDDLGNIGKGNPRDDFFPDIPAKTDTPANPFQSVPSPPPLHQEQTIPPLEKNLPSNVPIAMDTAAPNLSSQSFFPEKSAPLVPEKNPAQTKSEAAPAPKQKSKLLLLSLIIVFLLLAGGGGYYYWFFVRNAASTPTTATAQDSTTPSKTAPDASSSQDTQNSKLRRLIVDTSQNPTETKNAVQKFASDFSGTASEGDLVEIKLLDKDNNPISKKDFISGFALTVPEAVSGKLSEDYSLFLKKEGGKSKLGIVFKTVTSANLSSEMRNWETTIVNNFNSLYLGQTVSAGTSVFGSSQYKSADIRYFNFSSPTDASLDYSVISNFLVIGTSKDTTRAILDYMSEK